MHPENGTCGAICRLATAIGLPSAGIDLRRTQEGRWYCFEVNPSPGFTFYQDATGQRIAEAVAILLANCKSSRLTRGLNAASAR
jgi:D-alanine-D-alanine ligase-like ATP-grasp enzyme